MIRRRLRIIFLMMSLLGATGIANAYPVMQQPKQTEALLNAKDLSKQILSQMIFIPPATYKMGTDNPRFFGMDGNAHVHEVT